MSLNEQERAIRRRLRDDFPHYAPRALKVLPKAGGEVVPFTLNPLQVVLHDRLEEQRARTGRVRALVLKGRQVGISTYVGGRYYWRATHQRGARVYILTHEQAATDTLFQMVERYHEHCPALVRPSTSTANAKELAFDRLDSGYQVGTAGTKAVGRSKMVRYFHGSEVAFWPHASTHFAGIVQAIPDLPGTEIILESTANGMGDEFHQRWQQAEAGIGDYIAVFLPWFGNPDYRRAVPPGFELDDEEIDYAEAYGLDLEQMVWRRAKLAELKDPLLFKQEYPATAAEAFQNTGHDSYIKPTDIVRARKAEVEGIGPLVLGVDPSRFGDDRFSIAHRRGRAVLQIESKAKLDTVAGANFVKSVIDRDKPARVFVDAGGIGGGTYDLLVSWGYGPDDKDIVHAVNFGGEPMEPILFDSNGQPRPGPRNRRAEMWMRSRDWLLEPAGVSIPDSDALQADACAPTYTYDTHQRLLLESKEKMRLRGIRSPDEWDAVALTFAEPVAESVERKPRRRPRGGGWMGA